MTNEDVISRWIAAKPNPRQGGAVRWGTGNVYSDCERVIYSYGRHFPLAVRLGKDSFLLNGDRYSVTTSRHQSDIQYALQGQPTVSFEALRALGVRPEDLTAGNIRDYTRDRTTYLSRVPDPDAADPDATKLVRQDGSDFEPPAQGQLVENRWSVYWHILGATLIRHYHKPWNDEPGEWRYYLCSLDEGTYFVSRLSRPAATVDSALWGLKPYKVQQAIRAGESVIRQGEWFFVPTGLADRDIAKLANLERVSDLPGFLRSQKPAGIRHIRTTAHPLPTDNPSSNEHWCTHAVIRGETYARGKVIHRDPWSHTPTGEHRSVTLRGWFRVYKNTELDSRSIGGKFD